MTYQNNVFCIVLFHACKECKIWAKAFNKLSWDNNLHSAETFCFLKSCCRESELCRLYICTMDIVFGQILKFLEVSVDVVYFTFATKGPKLKAT